MAVAFAVGFLFEKLAQSKEAEIQDLEPKVQQIQAKSDSFTKAYARLQATQKEAGQITDWMQDRYYWGDVLTQLRGALIRSENNIKAKLSAQKPGVEAGVWIEQLTSAGSLGSMSASGPDAAANAATDANGAAHAGDNSVITIVCRAVNLTSVDPSANSEIAYAVETELKACPIFDPKTTQLTGQMTQDDSTGTFTFGVTVTLLNPLQL